MPIAHAAIDIDAKPLVMLCYKLSFIQWHGKIQSGKQ